jgi:hypothetical protein
MNPAKEDDRMTVYPTEDALEEALAKLGGSPEDRGVLEMIVSRPRDDERQELENATLDLVDGLVGDNWLQRGSRRTEDGSAHPDMQVAIMNSRIMKLVAPDRSRWPLAGDQLFIDLDLSSDNLPPGQKISVGQAILEITDAPHTGCRKFSDRFGSGALRFVNSKEGRTNRRRGIYARVVRPGKIRVNDVVTKVINAE